MKIALGQINTTVGALEKNRDKILDYYKQALDLGAELVVFPELAITGYPPQDLLHQGGFVENNIAILEEIALKSRQPVLLGFVNQKDGNLFNSAALCAQGRVIYTYDKMLLPTYDVFDESRYFEAGSFPGVAELEISGKKIKIGIEICEDLWDDDYGNKVTKLLEQAEVDLIVNISASPYHDGRLLDRCRLIERKVSKLKIPFIYCNLVGAQDELIFDGQSLAFNKSGRLIGQGIGFQEDLIIVDPENGKKVDLKLRPRPEKLYQALCLGVKDYFSKTGHKEAVLGLSGGIDSSLAACIAVDALGPENVHGISMPSKYSSGHSKSDALALAHNLGLDFSVVQIENTVKSFEKDLYSFFKNTIPGSAEENIQARIRGTLLMALSNKFDWMVLSTGNKTETALGYCTLYGDMNGGLAVISDLSKQDVYVLANWVNENSGKSRIPENSISKPPSAELKENQIDPFNYEVVSPLVSALIEDNISAQELIEGGAPKELVEDLVRRIRINEFKRRQAPPGLRVTSKAFGMGRRYPIVNQYMQKINK